MTTASAIAFLQPGIQPGLKARSGGETGENPFAALLASLGIEAGPEGTAAAAGAATAATAGANASATAEAPAIALPAPLQLLKDIGEALAKALEEGTDLPEFDQLPPEFQALLAQFAQLPDDLHQSLEALIGTDAVAALDELAAGADEIAASAPRSSIPGEPARPGEKPDAGNTAGTDTGSASARHNAAAPQTAAPETVPVETAPIAAAPDAATPARSANAATTPHAPVAGLSAPQASDIAASAASQIAIADDTAPDASAQAGGEVTDGEADAQPAAVKASAKSAAPATQATAAAVVNAATPSRVQQQTSSAAANADSPSSEDAARAQTAARDTTRKGLRGLLETLAAGPQANADATNTAPRAHAPQALAAAIQSAVSARTGSTPSAKGAPSADLPGVTATQSDPILLTADRPGQAAFTSSPARSVTVPAYGSSLPVSQLAVTISSQARAGTRHFDIRLDPPEMGRIDVRLEMNRDGVLSAQLTVDRPETYDALNRDARHLERMLQQSGMKLDGSSIQFSLRDGGGSGNGQAFEGQSGGGAGPAPVTEAETDAPAPAYARIPSSALVDIEV